MVNAANSFEVKTLNLLVGLDNKKSAVLPDVSLDKMPTPRFIAWIAPTSQK
jgi:hypothetical protein